MRDLIEFKTKAFEKVKFASKRLKNAISRVQAVKTVKMQAHRIRQWDKLWKSTNGYAHGILYTPSFLGIFSTSNNLFSCKICSKLDFFLKIVRFCANLTKNLTIFVKTCLFLAFLVR